MITAKLLKNYQTANVFIVDIVESHNVLKTMTLSDPGPLGKLYGSYTMMMTEFIRRVVGTKNAIAISSITDDGKVIFTEFDYIGQPFIFDIEDEDGHVVMKFDETASENIMGNVYINSMVVKDSPSEEEEDNKSEKNTKKEDKPE